ncbi:MFS transporter [Cellulomonas bogoriensis]|uniref:MFS transporter n=1 Tax=Cellulomonas bogoriensis TaxID=301388 RepID=UPI0012EC620D|nr:MFS transporter [Cellulomonas bogoriensis]
MTPDTSASGTDLAPTVTRHRLRVTSWALWDWGSAAFNAVITTFVFTRWITSESFADPDLVTAATAEGTTGPASAELASTLAQHTAWLGWGLALAGFAIALLAPALGARADGSGRRRRGLAVHTAVTVALSAAMALVRPDPESLTFNILLGITLLALANVAFELASVHYNAMLNQISTRSTMGRISGIGWGAGYVGGIVLLLLLFVGFLNPTVGWFGVTAEDDTHIRAAILVAALWFALFSVPVLLAVPEAPRSPTRAHLTFLGSYRQLARDVRALWHGERAVLHFLLASAVYRDGLAGVFTFGAVIAGGTFGFGPADVVVFAIAANVVAGAATFLGGFLDDRIGPKRVILFSLVGLLACGIALFLLHDGTRTMFWVFGLGLCLFVGPAQSASRSLLGRMIPPGRESELFGLYATTGRAASFLTPLTFSTFIAVMGAQYWGILGIVLVVGLGLGLLLPIRVPRRAPLGDEPAP